MSEISPLRPYSLLTCWQAGFRARTYRQPAREPDWQVSDPACFSRWPGSFASYDPESSSWRTFQRSLLGGWIPYSGRWPLSGMMRGGEVCEHQRWAHPIAENGGSVSRGWPTPSLTDFKGGHSPEVFDKRRARLKKKGINGNGMGRILCTEVRRDWSSHAMHAESPGACDARNTGSSVDAQASTKGMLSTTAPHIWPTMTASEAKRGHGYQRAQGRIYPTLTGATGAAKAWPTPIASNHRSGAVSQETMHRNSRPLNEVVVMNWPTPMAMQGNNAGSIQEWGGSSNPIRKTDPKLARDPLNPAWVEMLQGFPEGWSLTDGPPLRDHSTHGSHRAPDHDSLTTETD